ncbi:neuronal calcium sensor 2-like [Paramacrobiotus metropolitanus]|uniref:neuronal calcium sensor 2-like n=1 Tax=Paramacrobiotus metropolitanus TaxID=2943436 RepID=UPI0024461B71|nr:neuronal calcium sensor 2-like [Paramacrobiotus metropolitanus]
MGNREGKLSSRVGDSDIPGACKLKKSDMDFLKANTTFDEATISEWYIEFMRDCKNGKLSPQKFMEVYEVLCPGGEAKAFAKHAFRTFDKDRNGFIDFKEFLMAVNVTSSGTVEQKLKWAFNMVDIDGNGTIELNEMVKVIAAIQEMSVALAASRTHSSSTTNPVIQAASTLNPTERAKQIFSQMDANHDGILDEKEFMSGCMNDQSLVQMLLMSGSFT